MRNKKPLGKNRRHPKEISYLELYSMSKPAWSLLIAKPTK